MLNQGTLIWLDHGPTIGHEQNGHRPALVVSSTQFNSSQGGIVWLIPISSRIKHRAEEIALPDGLPVSGVLLLSHIKAFDLKARSFKIAGEVSDSFLDEEVLGRIIAVFG